MTDEVLVDVRNEKLAAGSNYEPDSRSGFGLGSELGSFDGVDSEYELNLSDFALFLSVMKNKEAYRNTLSIILDEDIELDEVKVEQVVLNKEGKRAIRLDAWAKSPDGREFDMEMQNDTAHDDVRKRSRYYQGLLDTPVLKSGRETLYKNLPSTVVIFITQDDIFRKDLAMYTFTEQCEEIQGLHLEDGTTKLFLNMSSRNGRPELVSLLQYMKNTRLDNPEIIVQDERIVKLDKVVEEVKQSEEWEAVRMNILDIGIQKGRAEGRAAGVAEGHASGLAEGIAAYIGLCREMDISVEETKGKIVQNFNLSDDEAEKYMQQYWKD